MALLCAALWTLSGLGLACLPDLGAELDELGEGDGGDAAVVAPPDAGEGDAGTTDGATSDAGETPGGKLCDDSPPSIEVERYVFGQGFQFYFTPKGQNIFALEVPANSLVHFKLAEDPNEEAHSFTVTLTGCETPETGMGTEGNEVNLDWKAPARPGIYTTGGKCRQHPGMEFDVVVTP